MRIDEAIEILTDQAKEGLHYPREQRQDAIKLGIEALKRCNLPEAARSFKFGFLLPGETEE